MISAPGGASKLARRFRAQGESCAALGSPLYSALLARAADDLETRGPLWRAAGTLADLPGGALASLRFMGAIHRLALSGRAPALAAHYPSCGGDGDPHGAWTALLALCERSAGDEELAQLLTRGVQTNEVGRAAAMLGGFLSVARSTGLPLRLLEVGTSAGLNLRWDHFHYVAGDQSWGPLGSAVEQGDVWVGDRLPELSPPMAELEIADRHGCDIDPLDPTTSEGRRTLLSFDWPDMERRLRLLDGACTVAAAVPAKVDRAPADAWLADRLASVGTGVATVVFHSVFLQYMETAARSRLLVTLTAAGERATSRSPLAWLRLEPPGGLGSPDFEVRLTTWPGARELRLAASHPHGAWVRWEA